MKGPNFVVIFTNAGLLSTLLKYVISDSELNQTILDSIYSLRRISLPRYFSVCNTHVIASIGAVNVLLCHHLTYEGSFLVYLRLAYILEHTVELVMIFHAITDASRPSQMPLWNCEEDISAFRLSIMVGVLAVWRASIRALLL